MLTVCLVAQFYEAEAYGSGCSNGKCWVQCHDGSSWCDATEGRHGNGETVSCESDSDCSASNACAHLNSDGESDCTPCKGWNGCGDK